MLRLIARGLSNTEISDTLFIAEQTTKTHVGRILAKLGLRDRAQAVVIGLRDRPGHAGRRRGLLRSAADEHAAAARGPEAALGPDDLVHPGGHLRQHQVEVQPPPTSRTMGSRTLSR